jgi:hypothetical protein
MNYNLAIQEIIDVTKADKSINAEWRNKAVSRLKEARAFIREGKTTTNRTGPVDMPTMQFAGPQCICTDLGTRKDCPVHGVKA